MRPLSGALTFLLLAHFGRGYVQTSRPKVVPAGHHRAVSSSARSSLLHLMRDDGGSSDDALSSRNLLSPGKLLQRGAVVLGRLLTSNPIARIFTNAYTFFYWLPKRNTPYDLPWTLFKNSTVEWIAWYQFPHNLPPYRYLDLTGFAEGYREDFFCYGLPGNTLPLGNWDPAGFQLVQKRVLLKYRESELKQGRLAMLASLGMWVQEAYHPLHPEIGGLAITHMAQLRENLSPSSGLLPAALGPLVSLVQAADPENAAAPSALLDALPLDYIAACAFLAAFEAAALRRNWSRWKDAEYNHQFDQNIGIGNLKESYRNGDYGFDPLRLMPTEPAEARDMQERELNNGRLASVAVIGMIGQEYLTGLPLRASLDIWLGGGGGESGSLSPGDAPSLLDSILSIPRSLSELLQSLQTEGLGGLPTPVP